MAKTKIPKIVGFLMLVAFLFGAGYLLPYTLFLGKAGLLDDKIASQVAIYSDISLFFVGLIVVYLINYLWKGNDKYGDNIGIHNKEEGILKNFTYMQITLLSSIFFFALFFFANLSKSLKQGIVPYVQLPQQFSALDSVSLSTAQIPIAENVMFAFAVGLIALIVTLVSIKYNLSKKDHVLYKFMSVIIGSSILGWTWHQTVYSNSSIAGIVVAVFWGIGGLLCLLTGSFIPFLALHVANNLTIDLSRLYSNDFASGMIILFIITLVLIYGFIYRKNKDWLKGADRYK
jgi:hypothetical protein